jgi:hypothetical protein
MKRFVLGLLIGAAAVYWSGYRSDVVAEAVVEWVVGAADNYRGEGDPVADDAR